MHIVYHIEHVFIIWFIMKRSRDSSAEDSSSQRREVTFLTYKKWLTELDRCHQTISWLDCDTRFSEGKRVVTRLKCRVCTKHKARISGRKHFNNKWIEGAESIRTSNIRDHANADQHIHAMEIEQREQAQAKGQSLVVPSGSIIEAFSKIGEQERSRLKVKFDIAYFVAIEKMAYTKYSKVCQLEVLHGVDLGTSYRNDVACKTFCHFISQSKRQSLNNELTKAKFFSLLLDGSTDCSNVENVMFLAVYCDTNASDEKVHSKMTYLTVDCPSSATGEGLFASLEKILRDLGFSSLDTDACRKLIGVGTDGASANIAGRGLKGLVEAKLDWICWVWCLAHRLELAIKDALTGTVFDHIDDMLTRLFYLYSKSPKKCREIQDIITDLTQCLTFDDNGIKPIRASGTRWISHKINAMKRVLSKFGVYTNHIASLIEDSSTKAADKAKLKGYMIKWTDAKYLLGCALFVDLLTPCVIFSNCMQEDELNLLAALTFLLRTIKETDKLCSKSLEQWPVYNSTLQKLTEEDGQTNVYQLQKLKNLREVKSMFENNYKVYCTKITNCIKQRLEWSDLQLFRDVIEILATQGWQKIVDELEHQDESGTTEPWLSVKRLSTRFKLPLESAGTDVDAVLSEFKDMVEYAIQFFSLSTMDYQAVWWRLFHCPCSSEWKNCLSLVELLFSLPSSNGKLERTFSQLKIIKTEKRSLLNNQQLDDCLG